MKVNSLEKLFDPKLQPCLFVGNGINRYAFPGGNSWTEMLLRISEEVGAGLTEDAVKQMSSPEVYDVLDFAVATNKSELITNFSERRQFVAGLFCESMADWRPQEVHTRVAGWAIRHRTPIMTTNFDTLLAQAAKAQLRHLRKSKGFRADSDLYPWDRYYGLSDLQQPGEDFSIWHPHGMLYYKRSIKLGLDHYTRSAARVVDGLRSVKRESDRADFSSWRFENTWLQLWFTRPIIFFGFGFGKDESFLRWMLLKRRQYMAANLSDYVSTTVIVSKNGGQEAYFQSLGVDVVNAGHEELYEAKFWAE